MLNGYLTNMFGLYLLMIISSITANHIGTSSLPNLSIIKSGSYHYCTITNDTLGSALLWDYQNTDNTPSSNVHCTLNGNYECTLKNLQRKNWHWIDDKNVSPILDYRWETFKALTLTDDPQEVYETIDGNFRISFSVKIKEVHILLCDDLNYDYYLVGVYSNCYWIGLGANGGKKSYIRKCTGGAVPTNPRGYPADKTCAKRQEEFVGSVISETQWNHFTVLKQGNTITVWNYGQSKPILTYTDRSQNVFITRHVVVRRSYSYTAYHMKIHEVQTLTTNKPSAGITIELKNGFPVKSNCLALYVKSCKGCNFNVNLSSRNKVLKQMTTKSLAEEWQEILLRDENNFTEINEISLQTLSEVEDNAEELYWHISNTIRKCGSADFAMKKGDEDGCCYALKYPNQKICTANIKDMPNEGDWTCPANTIGKNCIPCTSIPGRSKCDYSKICDVTSNGSICSCAPGYYDKDCQSICPKGRYGLNCRMECGRCKYTCNNVDGICSSCEENFEGDTCQTASLPLLKNAPKIKQVGHTNLTVMVDMEYEGKEDPYFYEILYQENYGIWTQQGPLMRYQSSQQSITVNNLKTSTKYKIKIILQTSNGSKYDGKFVPEAEFETTCADVAQDILQNKVTNTSIVIRVDVNKPQYQEICALSQYRLMVYDIKGIYSVYNKPLETENTIETLKPYTDYRIEIQKNNVIILNTILRTSQGAPGPVQNIKYLNTNTTVGIKWEDPFSKNGYITGYRIQYRHLRYRMCDINSYSSGSDTVISATNTTVTVNNLVPYSDYNFKIWAVTEYDGKSSENTFQTTETSSPSEEEIPDLTFTDSNRQLNVMIKWKCEKLKGPLRFRAELTCISEWCLNRTQRYNVGGVWENGGKSESKLQFERIGKTEYILKFFISRNNDDIFSTKPLTTAPSSPGRVKDVTIYSKNSSSISIRWLPPYPPEGDIESYWVTHYQFSIDIEIKNTAFCKLWPEYICVTITGLQKYKSYYFQIKAKNIGVSEKGQGAEVTGYTEEEAPERPKNMTLQWDEQYGLTIGWPHPSITNGVLREFLLYINDGNPASYPVTDENPQYQYKMNIPENLLLQKLKIGIQARNSAGVSRITTDYIFSPPKTPKFTQHPNIDDIKDTSFNINIPEISNIEGESSKMYIIITNTQKRDVENQYPPEQKLFKEIGLKLDNSWTVGEFDLTNSNTWRNFNFKVGNESETVTNADSSWILNNRKLETGTAYKVSIILNNTFLNFVRYKLYTLNCTMLQSEGAGASYLLLLLLIPVLLLCVGGVLYMKGQYIKMDYICNFNTPRAGSSRVSHEIPLQNLTASNEILSEDLEHPGQMDLKCSRPVRIADLNMYVKNAIRNEILVKQYKLISQHETKASIHSSKIKNKLGRDREDSRYDHSRVKLRNADKKWSTNNINANYVNGYGSRKTFIATVVPKSGKSTNQFWQMIWQENVEYIILIANVVQPVESKFEKYWPDLKNSRSFDNINVELDKIETNINYEVRHFKVFCNRKMRQVLQFHYLTWPDYGMPSHVRKLIPFLKKVLGFRQGKSPIVVHCSADVDYTGSLILCNICLRMAAHEGKMDVPSCLSEIRQQRDNMVCGIEQYKLVYLALLQCVSIQNTGILSDEFMEKKIEIQMKEKIEEEMKYLDDHAWQDEMEFTSNPNSNLPAVEDTTKNSTLVLNSSADRSPDRIDVVAVDSFSTSGKFIVTQNPKSDVVKDLGDFWVLVAKKQITTIICLNHLNFQNKESCYFFPTSTGYPLIPTPQVEIRYLGKDVKTHYVVYILLLNRQDDIRESNTHVKVMLVKNWSSDMLHPDSPIGLLTTYEEMNKLGHTDAILITCRDGARASGLFVAMCFVIDKLKADQLCDVSLAVRTVRRNRKEFVREKEQFSFLYQCVVEYVRQFGLYSTPNN